MTLLMPDVQPDDGGHAPIEFRPSADARNSVTHSAPSGPVTILRGSLPAGSGTGKRLTAPSRVTRATAPRSRSVVHIAPSGPRVIESGRPGTGTTFSSFPPLEMRATKLPIWSEVIQTSPPGPFASTGLPCWPPQRQGRAKTSAAGSRPTSGARTSRASACAAR